MNKNLFADEFSHSYFVFFQVEKELFLAHRHVLSARSTFFEAMFREESRWSETNKNTVPLGLFFIAYVSNDKNVWSEIRVLRLQLIVVTVSVNKLTSLL